MFNRNDKFDNREGPQLCKKWTPENIKACTELYDKHYKAAILFCFSRLKSREKSEDMVLETFLNITEVIISGDKPILDIKNYMYSSLRNNIINQSIKNTKREAIRRRLPVVAVHSEDHFEFVTDDFFDFLSRSLPISQKDCIELKRQGYSYKEIAEMNNYTVNQVKGYIERARKKIRAILSNQKKCR